MEPPRRGITTPLSSNETFQRCTSEYFIRGIQHSGLNVCSSSWHQIMMDRPTVKKIYAIREALKSA